MDIMGLLQPIGIKFTQEKYDECISDLELLWENLPEPKYEIQNAYNVIEYFCAILLKLKKYDEAYQWAIKGTNFNKERTYSGESEYLIGKIAMERNDYELAKDMFYIANKRSKGRCFKGPDVKNSEYKNMIKEMDIK